MAMDIVHPGEVRASDGQVHFVSYTQLCYLWRLNARECYDAAYTGIRLPRAGEIVRHFYPDPTGNYDHRTGRTTL